MKNDVRVVIHGDVGQVFSGPVTQQHFWTSGYPLEGMEGTPWWEQATDDELREFLRTEKAVFWRAWRRYWFNAPALLIAAMLLATAGTLAAAVLQNGPAGLVGTVEWWLPVGLFIAVLPTGVWMHFIRRVEGNVAAQAQRAIDEIEMVLSRRKGLRR